MTNKNNTLELKILPRVVLRAPRPNDRTVFFFLFYFLADLSYVGFVLVSDFWDISDRKQISLFVSKNKSSPMDLFLS